VTDEHHIAPNLYAAYKRQEEVIASLNERIASLERESNMYKAGLKEIHSIVLSAVNGAVWAGDPTYGAEQAFDVFQALEITSYSDE
jgi:cell division protein FtsB